MLRDTSSETGQGSGFIVASIAGCFVRGVG
jgi:hypothetical protein